MTTQRRGRRSFGRSTGPRRKTRWEQYIFNDVQLPATGAIVVADLTPEPMRTGGAHERGQTATLVRAIMHFALHAEVGDVNPQSMSLGIAVYSHEAQTGPTVMDPNSDPTQDWYYWASRSLVLESGDIQISTSWDADIRSKRCLRGGYDLLMTMAGFSSNSDLVSFNASMRLLWMMP